ncbi:hypothetical protein M407DRAFT_106748 [Tulasnella calospora MUT 4182]|uniref:Uncharacterized protein n=1 Tax=Tulasnella calospora MUT 4182 TaxID=1051891 RepID=A0A0C3KR53_9AGAM|nr:hypothetical protein M407DRAFT_106748 [Tulasnella calospora MUT 4182]
MSTNPSSTAQTSNLSLSSIISTCTINSTSWLHTFCIAFTRLCRPLVGSALSRVPHFLCNACSRPAPFPVLSIQ